MNYTVDTTAIVQSSKVGEQTQIWQYSVVLAGATIGRNCNINCHCFIENDVVVGDQVTLKSGVYLWDGITIEDNVFIGPNVTFTNDPNPRSKRRPSEFQKTFIMKGASIGAGAIILPGITIGEYALVGAGAVVTKDVPKHSLWFGNPAKAQGYVCYCGEKLNNSLQCEQCHQKFQFNNGLLMAL